MKNRHLIISGIICIITLATCKQSFEPDGKAVATNYLVVEGIINCGNDSTIINLSRTVSLSKKQTVKIETGALLSVESSTGIFYSLSETKKGTYKTAPLNLPLTNKYRLNIKTADGKIYQSDFVEAKVTPPIDDLPYDRTADGLIINVNAHDDSKKTNYYRWSFEETWKFHAEVPSYYESTGSSITGRFTQIYFCYRTEVLADILLASTLKLSNDVVYKRPLKTIPNRSERISEKYSINVRQYALTKEAYEFWENQRKNTEQLGGIFDSQPSELKGNIHCISTPAEFVVGFVSVSTETRKRIFITPEQVNWKQPIPTSCSILDTVFSNQVKDKLYFLPGGAPYEIPSNIAVNPMGLPIGYTAAPAGCVDCRLRGTVQTPPFWQ